MTMRDALLLAAGAAALLCACDWTKKPDAPDAKSPKELAAERSERLRKACASAETYAGLKDFVFGEAARIRNGDPRNLDPVAAGSVVRMEEPSVKSRDDRLDVTVCTGRFILELPPGAENAFDGLRRVDAEVEYSAQAAADRSGIIYRMDGAEPIIYRLATFGFSTARPGPGRTAAAPKAPPETPVEVVQAERKPVPAEPKAGLASAAPKPGPVPLGPASPSYNCRYAHTTSERYVCGSPALAARDRAMSAVYYRSVAAADAAAKRRLRASRDAFLIRRERCGGNESCIGRTYEERVAEIRRIAAE